MAPSPVLNIEPKGPDKSAEKCMESVSTNDKQNKSKTVDDNATSKDKISVDQLSFAEIEEAGLKSLLDEAYSYKSPKDRLGKSDLFQVLLNEVEENDAGKKKLSERSNSFADGRGNASVSIGNGHETANDKTFLNNILGSCEKDKKKKKNKRESSGTNGGSRRPKFSHSMKVNSGPQSSSSSHLYNGNNTNNSSSSNSNININNNTNSSNISSSTNSTTSSTSSPSSTSSTSSSSSSSNNSVHYNGGSRSLSRAHQSFASRINNSKTAALLTSSSNIDIPMVTTYNKQPIMTPALVPSSQKSAELIMLDLRDQNGGSKSDDVAGSPKSCFANGAEKESDIEMKILETKNTANSISSSNNNSNNDSVYNYTTHASLEIGAGNTDACKQFNDCDKDNDTTAAVIFPLQSSASAVTAAALLNGNADRSSMQHGNSQKPMNGFAADEKEEIIDNVICNNNSNTESMANLGRNICTKDSLESRRLYDENGVLNSNYPYLSSNSGSMNRDRLDNVSERKHKIRKPKKQNTTSVLSENIEGYCGDKSVEYLVDYIENTKAGGGGGSATGGPTNVTSDPGKALKSKSASSASRNGDRIGKIGGGGGKASTDDDVRSKKPNRAKERLKKSTSLEDLRPSSSKAKQQQQNKKQSSVDDSHYISKESNLEVEPLVARPPIANLTSQLDYQVSTEDASLSQRTQPQDDFEHQHRPQERPELEHQLQLSQLDHSLHSYYDTVDHVDDDNYTETEFHLVTKKHRKKKRRSKSRSSTLDHQKHQLHHSSSHHQSSHSHHNGIHDGSAISQNFLPHHYTDKNDSGNFAAYQNSKRSTRSSENRHRSRRKSVSSVVPSDKISDSDSIHSLPVSSTTPKCKIKKKSTSSGCTPQASYADIAKSPQCNSSTTLNGNDKWHRSLKTFSSNSPSASCSLSSSSAYSTQNTCGSGGSVTTASSFGSSSASSSNTGDSPEHSDNSELACAASNTLASDQSCDLNCNSASCGGEPAADTTVDDGLIDDKDSGCGSVNDSGANEDTVEALATVTPSKRKNKSSAAKNGDTTVNETSMAHCNGAAAGAGVKIANGTDTTKMPKDYHSNISNNSSSILINNASNNINHSIVNNTNNTKVKKTRNKKNKNAGVSGTADEAAIAIAIADVVNDNHSTAADASAAAVATKTSAGSGDLFVEFTLKSTKCSETQTDLETIEVNNNACGGYHHHHHHLRNANPSNSNGCNDVSVEETIVLKCSTKSHPTVGDDPQSGGVTYVDKLSHSLPIHKSETGQVTRVSNDRNCPADEINVVFNVDDELLEGDSVVATADEASDQRRLEIQKEIIERSSKYNVTEVIQYVNKSWNEVMNLASSKVTNTNNKKVQYYASK